MSQNFDRGMFKATPIIFMVLESHKHKIVSELDSFKNYIVHTQDNIKDLQKKLEDKMSEELSKTSDDEDLFDLHEYYELQHIEFHQFHPTTFNNSTLITLFSFLETSLKSLCDSLHRHKRHKIQVTDLKGNSYIDQSRKYLILVEGINLDDINDYWIKISNYRKIRNCIVHNNSKFFTDKEKSIDKQNLYSLISKSEHLQIDKENGTFYISNYIYLLEFCEIIETYMRYVIKQIADSSK
ncbi:MAG: hypothetical protein H6582_08265 [Crocinitomicaceae bacterium]|nr:hypothetical protein [Crocinitomicaceae bacterium]